MENKENKSTLEALWDMRYLTVEECLQKISNNPNLQFLLTTVGAWLLVRWIMGIWIGAHVVYLFCRIFKMVIG